MGGKFAFVFTFAAKLFMAIRKLHKYCLSWNKPSMNSKINKRRYTKSMLLLLDVPFLF